MFQTLTSRQKQLWKIGATVVGLGSFIKFGYFYVSREMIIDNLEKRDKAARSYLKESVDFAEWAAKDREKRMKHKLTPEQREQMQQYLIMMAEENKDVYPYEGRSMRARGGS